MHKTITLRLNEEIYKKFLIAAESDNRPISNLIETLALKKLQEDMFVEDYEMDEILGNKKLIKKLKRGSEDARVKRGRLVG